MKIKSLSLYGFVLSNSKKKVMGSDGVYKGSLLGVVVVVYGMLQKTQSCMN